MGTVANLRPPPQEVRDKIAREVPRYVQDLLQAIGHDPIAFDQRGRIRSRCRLSGKEVTQTQQVGVTAGADVRVDFPLPAATAKPAPAGQGR